MTEFEKIWDFNNLYKAHKAARLGKRDTREVINFEMNLATNLSKLSDSIRDKTYAMSGYYNFYVYDPKKRKIHALHYIDRVVQHCLCDEVLAPIIDKKLVYDNAACRLNKGNHFAIARVSKFLRDFYQKNGSDGYFLKFDIRKFFDSIDHNILKAKLHKLFSDKDIRWLLDMIIDSFQTSPGKGLPMGNQTSQWFAIYYLDILDRLIKERLHIKYYSRYMDDGVLIHKDKDYLKECLMHMQAMANNELLLDFNEKTQIFPLRNGVDYLGFHIYLTDTGKVIRKLKQQTKKKYKKKLKYLAHAYRYGNVEFEEIQQILASYKAHLSYGHTDKLQQKILSDFTLTRETK